MKAAVLESPQRLTVKDIPEFPMTEPDELMIEVAACGICGSDLRYYLGENPWALHTLGEERPNPPNIVMGHEYAGKVVEVNDPANQALIGSRVGVLCFQTCGKCRFCRTGRDNLCKDTRHMGHGQGWGERDYFPGAYAERCLGWAGLVYELPEQVSFEHAAMLDILAVAVHVARRGNIRPGGTVLCMGAGPAGNAIMQTAKLMGAARVIMSEVSPIAIDIAQQCRADLVIDVNQQDLETAVMQETNGQGVCTIYNSIGSEESIRQALKMLDGGGTMVNMAVHAGQVSLDNLALGSERSICSSSNFSLPEFQEALEYLAAGRYKIEPWITHRFPLEHIQDAFDLLLSESKQAFKVVIEGVRPEA